MDYVYDPMHRLIQKNVDGTKTRYVYSGWQRLADYDGTSDILQNRYVYGSGLDEPLITVSAGGVLTYMHADQLGSIAALTNDTGVVTERYAYSPWGASNSLSGTTFGFTGQRYDAETGLYYFKNRYYSPALGRFLQPDPLVYSDSLNIYSYAVNDPLNMIDPLGLESCKNKNKKKQDDCKDDCWNQMIKYFEDNIIGLLIGGGVLFPQFKPFVGQGTSPFTTVGSKVARKVVPRVNLPVRVPTPTIGNPTAMAGNTSTLAARLINLFALAFILGLLRIGLSNLYKCYEDCEKKYPC